MGETAFRWAETAGVHHLAIQFPDYRAADVYTTGSSLPFAALAGLGIDLERNAMRVDARLAWLPGYADMDHLTSPRASAATRRESAVLVESEFISIPGELVPVARPRAFKPVGSPGLPLCSAANLAAAVGALPAGRDGTVVSLRGRMSFAGKWCTMARCDCCNDCSTYWVVRPAQDPGTCVLLQRADDANPLTFIEKTCRFPQTVPDLDVVATGMLLPYQVPLALPGEPSSILDDARVCVVKAGER